MDVKVLNEWFETTHIIDSYESLVWTERFYECGDFELRMAMNSELLDIFKIGNYLELDESKCTMIIEKILIESDAEEGNTITISGRSFESVLDRRIVWGFKNVDTDMLHLMEELFDENIVQPSDDSRVIPSLFYDKRPWDTRLLDIEVEKQITGESMYDLISSLCQQHSIGFEIVRDKYSGVFDFKCFYGVDRSYGSTEAEPVVFSPEFDNLENSNYLTDSKPYKTATLIGGEGEGSEQRFYGITDGSEGLERREIYTDAHSVSSEDDGRTLTDEEYNALLMEEGIRNLVDNCNIETAFDGEADIDIREVYGHSLNIGDIVEIADAYGNHTKVRIVEVIFSDEASGFRVYPSFKSIDSEREEYQPTD